MVVVLGGDFHSVSMQ